jgi:hypothetical protein
MRADEVEDDPPIDVTRRFARGYLKICKIDLPHLRAAPSSSRLPDRNHAMTKKRFSSWRELNTIERSRSQQKRSRETESA